MSLWVGYFSQRNKKYFIKFNSFKITDSLIECEGYDYFGDFIMSGTVCDDIFDACKSYKTWDILYKGFFDRKNLKIFGFWGFESGKIGESFEIKQLSSIEAKEYLKILEFHNIDDE